MAIKVNLLPSERKVSGNLGQILKITRMLGVIALAIFLVLGLGVAGFFIFSTVELNSLKTANDGLKNQLTSLSTSEEQLVVLKDRIDKIQIIQKLPSATKNITEFVPFINNFPDITVNQLEVNASEISTSLVFRSNSELSTFIKSLSASTTFKNISMDSLSFSPTTGYVVSVGIVSK